MWGFGDLRGADDADVGSEDGSHKSTDGESGANDADGASLSDATIDADGQQDAADDDSSPIVDSAPAVDSAPPTCTPFPSGTMGTCRVTNNTTQTYAIPSLVCDEYSGLAATPAVCADCVEDYTCACLLAAKDWCPGGQESCTLQGGYPLISTGGVCQ